MDGLVDEADADDDDLEIDPFVEKKKRAAPKKKQGKKEKTNKRNGASGNLAGPAVDESSSINPNLVKANNKLVGTVEMNDLYCSDDGGAEEIRGATGGAGGPSDEF